ncbi:MAG: type II toxin-antitoxin system RelE/ParE family toxin [Candidatus Diapherotrites archaeon]|nr:type II toxin-antitoxin system RelE/ParE family toxin [Candidatus Diapherotrites archaeon]
MILLPYSLEVLEHVERAFEKAAKRDPEQEKAIKKKLRQILENPYNFKPLKKPMHGLRRVHAHGPFVLIYSIDENRKTVIVEDYDHHDSIYKK